MCCITLACSRKSNDPLSPNSDTDKNPFHSVDSLTVSNFLGFSIDPNNTGYLKTYSLANTAVLVQQYRNSGMKFFVPMGVYWNRDENNVPTAHYSFGDYRNPVTTCHTTFGYHRYYLEYHQASDKQNFINNIEWLCDEYDEFIKK